VFLVFDNGSARYNVLLSGLDPRTWRPGAVTVPTQTVTLPAMTAGTYKLALWLPDQAVGLRGTPAYSVRLANTGTWDAAKGYNVLANTITVGSCTADCVPPSAPTLTAGSVTSTSVSLSWTGATDNVGVTGYQVRRDGTVVGTVTGTTFTDTAVPAGSHAYAVTARDAAGNESVTSNTVTVGVGCTDCAAPSTPTGLAVPAITTTSISLSWNAATDNVGVTGYQVFRNGTQVASLAGTTFTDTGLVSGSYTYTVKARDAAGNVSPASAPLTATTATPRVTTLIRDLDQKRAVPPDVLRHALGVLIGVREPQFDLITLAAPIGLFSSGKLPTAAGVAVPVHAWGSTWHANPAEFGTWAPGHIHGLTATGEFVAAATF
jgi:chitodextrinase